MQLRKEHIPPLKVYQQERMENEEVRLPAMLLYKENVSVEVCLQQQHRVSAGR